MTQQTPTTEQVPEPPGPARGGMVAAPGEGEEIGAGETEVVEFFAALDKAVRARRLYQANNPVYQGFRSGLEEAVGRLWDVLSTVSVGVDEHAFRWHGRSITVGEHRESLPFLFYRDGVRFLTFLPGFELEIDAFLGVLDRARMLDQRSDDDMVTLLWQAEFVNFQYTYVDALAEGLVIPEATGEQQVGVSFDMPAGEAAEQAAAAPEPYAVQGGQPPLAQLVTREDFAETLYFLDGAEFDQLAAMVQQELKRDVRRDVVTALFDRLEDDDLDRRGEILGILRQLMPTFLAGGELGCASQVLTELSGVLQAGILAERERERAEEIFRELSEPGVLEQLLTAVENGSIDPAGPELGVFLAHLEPRAMPQLLQAIETSTMPALQERLRFAMQGLAETHQGHLIEMLRAESVDVVRGAARIVAQLGLGKAAAPLAELLRHPAVPIRQVAVEALASLRNAPALDALRGAIEDDDRDVRVAAARGLAAARYLPARDALSAIIEGRAIRDFDLTEKIAFFEAFGAVAAPDSVKLLDRLLNGRRLFGRESAELRACAAMALGKMATPAARASLEKALGETEPLVRNAVAKALRGEALRA